jgi:hypothetical protein
MGNRARCEGNASENEVGARRQTFIPRRLLIQNPIQPGRLRRNLMNALQIIPPKPVATVRRSAFRFFVSGAILLLLLALVGGMNTSRGEEGAASEPGAAIALKDNRDNVSDKDVSPSTTQPATASAGATMQVSGTGSGELKTSAPAQSAALPAMPALACIRNHPDVGRYAGEPPATEAKPGSGRAPINDRNGYDDRDGSRARAMPSATCSASAASKEDLTSKPEDGRAAGLHPTGSLVAWH